MTTDPDTEREADPEPATDSGPDSNAQTAEDAPRDATPTDREARADRRQSADAAGESDRGESTAVAAFERLGLTSYEAKVFIALQRIGGGTARDVSEVTDVPRSQVYGVTDSLAERGLVSVQQSSPKRFRPVSVEAARTTLLDRFERESERAFDYVERVRRESDDREREEIWTIRGRDAVDDRAVELIESADSRVVFGVPTVGLVADRIADSLAGAAVDGVDVAVTSSNLAVRERFGSVVTVSEPPPAIGDNDACGRFVFVDDDSVLLSILDADGGEVAVWSAESRFAGVFIRLVEGSLGL